MNMERQRLLIDTDMGNDDIMAICMMLLNPTVKIEGFTVTAGVSDAQIGAKNLLNILTYCDKDIPVAIGPQRKFQTQLKFPDRDIQRAQDLTLLSNLDIPTSQARPLSFQNLMAKVSQEPFTILALAPLTNLAAIIQNSQVKNNMERIILMGGAIEKGNVPPEFVAEYNIALDPQSANEVFTSDIPITLVGLNATSQVPATLGFKNKIAQVIPLTKEAQIIQAIVLKNDGDFDAFYDPLAAYLLTNPSAISQKLLTGITVTKTGQTILSTKRKNVTVVLKVNSQSFYEDIERIL